MAEEENDEQAVEKKDDSEISDSDSDKKPFPKKLVLIIVAAILLLVIIGGAAFFFLGGDESEQADVEIEDSIEPAELANPIDTEIDSVSDVADSDIETVEDDVQLPVIKSKDDENAIELVAAPEQEQTANTETETGQQTANDLPKAKSAKFLSSISDNVHEERSATQIDDVKETAEKMLSATTLDEGILDLQRQLAEFKAHNQSLIREVQIQSKRNDKLKKKLDALSIYEEAMTSAGLNLKPTDSDTDKTTKKILRYKDDSRFTNAAKTRPDPRWGEFKSASK